MNETPQHWPIYQQSLPAPVEAAQIEAPWRAALASLPHKIIVLDDDPTGVQTVSNAPVYTRWDAPTLREIVRDESALVFILTNSRALNAAQSAALHQQLGRDLARMANEEGVEWLLISRSDSTLRGHYPLETQTLRAAIGGYDGEIIIPFFGEGGRLTINDVHWVREDETLVPAAQTEFARDASFGYRASNLKEWVAEKSGGTISSSEVRSIGLESLRRRDIDAIAATLMAARAGAPVIVNAADAGDLKVFAIALARAWQNGRRFLFRTAASWVRIIAGQQAQPCLSESDFAARAGAGLIVVGSHVAKTTRQLEALRGLDGLQWIEWRVTEAQTEARFDAENARVIAAIQTAMAANRDVCLHTSREVLAVEDALEFGARVSQGLVRAVQSLEVAPSFLVAKGGITSSDIGVTALGARRAMVMGQIAPGVPVWQLGAESRFPALPYVIFPGNVGDDDTLRCVVETLRRARSGKD